MLKVFSKRMMPRLPQLGSQRCVNRVIVAAERLSSGLLGLGLCPLTSAGHAAPMQSCRSVTRHYLKLSQVSFAKFLEPGSPVVVLSNIFSPSDWADDSAKVEAFNSPSLATDIVLSNPSLHATLKVEESKSRRVQEAQEAPRG